MAAAVWHHQPYCQPPVSTGGSDSGYAPSEVPEILSEPTPSLLADEWSRLLEPAAPVWSEDCLLSDIWTMEQEEGSEASPEPGWW